MTFFFPHILPGENKQTIPKKKHLLISKFINFSFKSESPSKTVLHSMNALTLPTV